MKAIELRPLERGETCSGGPEAHEAHLDVNGQCPWLHDPCIHVGVFASDKPTEHCYTCGRDVPRTEL